MNWNRCIILFPLLFAVFILRGQSVSYTYKPLAAEGCSVKYSVAKQDSLYYVIVTVQSDRMRFLKSPTMMVRTVQDEVIKLQGDLLDNSMNTYGITMGSVVYPVSAILSTAQFYITPSQFELLKSGVLKVRLSTTPFVHERSFKKDKIGKKLYKLYQALNAKESDF